MTNHLIGPFSISSLLRHSGFAFVVKRASASAPLAWRTAKLDLFHAPFLKSGGEVPRSGTGVVKGDPKIIIRAFRIEDASLDTKPSIAYIREGQAHHPGAGVGPTVPRLRPPLLIRGGEPKRPISRAPLAWRTTNAGVDVWTQIARITKHE
jgi:hypothetical protein